MSIRGVVFDFWIDEHALRNFTSAGASDWAEMEHSRMGLRRALPCPTLCGSWLESRLSDLGLSPRDLAFRSIGRTQRQARSRARIAPHSSLRASTCRIV